MAFDRRRKSTIGARTGPRPQAAARENGLIIWRCALVGLAFSLAGCAGAQQAAAPTQQPKREPPPRYTEFRQLTAGEKKIIAAGVLRGLRDPDSARLRWAKYPRSQEPIVTYCGMLNAKNAYGGYVGFRPFAAGVIVKDGKIVGAALVGTGDVAQIMCAGRGLSPREAE